MILEEETFEAFGYHPSDFAPHSDKYVIAACDGCGKRRTITKAHYRALCPSCGLKGGTLTEEHKAKISATLKGRKPTEESKALMRAAQKNVHSGEKHPNWKGGRMAAKARDHAKRDRELGYSLLMPLKKGEHGHHITNEYVIGVPTKVHQSMSGRTRKKHRTLVLQWLKENDKKKYSKALCVLANTSNPSGL